MIAAASTNMAIGIKDGLPWHLPADLKYFKEKTLGHHIVMGRKTWELFPKPLPGRISIVISRSPQNLPEGVLGFSDLSQAIEFAKNQGEEELMIIGGGKLYESALHMADTLYLTHVYTKVPEPTARFPAVRTANWMVVHSEFKPKDEKNGYSMEFLILKRIGKL